MKIIPLLTVISLAIFLGGATCADNTVPDGNQRCYIPDALMVKYGRLPAIVTKSSDGTISLQELFAVWYHDIGQYNNLNTKDGALVDWVAKYCQAKPLSTTIVTPQASPNHKQTLFGD